MIRKGKRKASITAYMLVVCMLAGMFPSVAFAEQEEVFICDKTLHTHDDSCYQMEEDENKNPQKTLICEQEEHAHTEDCFAESAKAPQDSKNDTDVGEDDTNNPNDSDDDNLDDTQLKIGSDDEKAEKNLDVVENSDTKDKNEENTNNTEEETEQDPDEEKQPMQKRAREREVAQADGDHTDHTDWTELESDTSITNSGNYYLEKDVTLSGTLNITGNVEVTLCLNGHTLTGDGKGSVINVGSDAKLTLCDCSSGKTGTITGGNNSNGNGGGVYVQGANAIFHMTGGIISGNTAEGATGGGGVFVYDGAKFTMSDGKIFKNETTKGDGGGVCVSGGTFEMNGGTISSNKTKELGGGVYVNGGTFTMNGGEISNNTSTSGGGVYVAYAVDNNKFTMSGGTISGNTASKFNATGGSGGGVYVADSTFEMRGGIITNNTAEYAGAGVYAANNAEDDNYPTNFTMTGGSITGNKMSDTGVSTFGGGVYVGGGTFEMSSTSKIASNKAGQGAGVYTNNSTFTMSAGEMSDNISNTGGGVYVNDSEFTMSGGAISGNTATLGGGVFIQSNSVISSFTMSGGTIGGATADDANTAAMGGGVLINFANFTMTDGTISGNTANFIDGEVVTGVGGGVCVLGQISDSILGKFEMSGGTISSNTANYDISNPGDTGFGGGVYVDGGAFTMSGNSKIINENSAYAGAGVCVWGENATFTMSENSEISGNKAAADGGGGGVYVHPNSIFGVSGGSVLGNTLADTAKTPNNVYLSDSKTIMIIKALTGENKIGVTVEPLPDTDQDTISVAEGTVSIGGGYTAVATDANYFISDAEAYKVDFNATDNTVILRKKQEFTVTFDVDGDTTTIPTQTVLEDGYAEKPTDPNKDGFYFGGWYKRDAAGELETSPFDFENTAITENITLVAQWTDKPVVTFNYNYNDAPAPTTQEVEKDTTVAEPTVPERDGYVFGGWYTEAECTTKYDFTQPVTQNITLYAKWTDESEIKTFTVTFDSKGGTTIEPITVEEGSILTSLPTPTMPPLTFKGWYTDNACKNPFDINTPINADITLYAKWGISVSVSNPLKASASGKVVYLDGSPVKGATVTVSNLMSGAVEATTTTDSDGKYSFANLVTTSYRITATATINGEEKTTGFQRISLKSGENTLEDLRFLVNAAVVKVEVETGGSSSDAIVDLNGVIVDGLDKVLEQETQGAEPDTVTQITLEVEDPSETEPDIAKKLEVAAILASRKRLPNYITYQNSKRNSTLEVEDPSETEPETATVTGRMRIPDNVTSLNGYNKLTVQNEIALSLKLSGNKTTITRPSNDTTSQAISEKMNSMNPPVVTTLPLPDGDKGLEMQKELEEQRASFNIVKTAADEMLNSPNKVPTKILNMIESPNSAKPKTLAAYDLAVAAEYDEALRPDTFWIDDDGIHICVQDMGYYTIVYTEYEVVETPKSNSGGRTGTWVKEEQKTEQKQEDAPQNTQNTQQNNQNTQQNAPITSVNCPKDSRCPLSKFTDMNLNEWYHDGVHYCVENGLMAGTGATQFEPNANATRAMIVAILWRLENSPVVDVATSFNDVVEGAYYKDAVCWAVSEGIISGYDDKTFAPNDSITREQMASILYRYTQYKGIDVATDSALNFADANEVSSYAIDAMLWACEAGIINGTSATTLSPKGNATRAQIAQMLKVYLNQ